MRLDHVVHAVADLEAAAEGLRGLGLHVVPGGDHPGWGTRNALCYFDLTYIELIAVRDAGEARQSDFGSRVLEFRTGGEGPGTVAFRTADIARESAALRAHGVPLTGPNPGSRRRPDGSVIAWQLALAPWPSPFLIEWGEPDATRRADLTARGAIGAHPLGPGLRLKQVGWAVADLDAAAARLAAQYGVAAGEPFADDALGCRCRPTDAGLLLCMPVAAGAARERLERRGEGPFLYDLTGAGAQRLTRVAGALFRTGQG